MYFHLASPRFDEPCLSVKPTKKKMYNMMDDGLSSAPPLFIAASLALLFFFFLVTQFLSPLNAAYLAIEEKKKIYKANRLPVDFN